MRKGHKTFFAMKSVTQTTRVKILRSLINARENDEYYECTREKANTIRDKDRATRNAGKGDDKRKKKTTGMQIARVRSEKNDFAGKKPTLSSVRCFPWEFRRRGEGRNLSCSSGVCNSLGEKGKKRRPPRGEAAG